MSEVRGSTSQTQNCLYIYLADGVSFFIFLLSKTDRNKILCVCLSCFLTDRPASRVMLVQKGFWRSSMWQVRRGCGQVYTHTQTGALVWQWCQMLQLWPISRLPIKIFERYASANTQGHANAIVLYTNKEAVKAATAYIQSNSVNCELLFFYSINIILLLLFVFCTSAAKNKYAVICRVWSSLWVW